MIRSLINGNNTPDVRQEVLNKVMEEFLNGKEEHSIYYQVRRLFSMQQDRYFRMPAAMKKQKSIYTSAFTDMKFEDKPIKNKLVQYAHDALAQQKDLAEESNTYPEFSDFLKGITDPLEGFEKIIDICKQFPDEWTILQLCKGPRPQTTYSDFESIYERDSDIYFTLLRHARSSEYSAPICLRFSDSSQVELFKTFAKISNNAKEYMQVSAGDVLTTEAKAKYFEKLKDLDYNIRQVIYQLKDYIFPWLFLFKGIPCSNTSNGNKKYKVSFDEVDKLCETFELAQKERILLSLAYLHSSELDEEEIQAICEELTNNKTAQAAILQLLLQIRRKGNVNDSPTIKTNKEYIYTPSNYPCMLIVDELLDHFFWEELNVEQEMCRVNSLHCLWNLYTNYKEKIKNGYLCLNITNGGCIVNPENNLPKSEMRLRSFFEYWTPSWLIKCKEKPTLEDLVQFFKRDCYVYAGHGSGLQYISGKHISKQNIDAVVFLFGCDSSRMHSNGLYSDLMGPHIYYQAAMCPCLVGSILPALDSHMDGVAVEILSRWIAPDSKESNWQQIDLKLWITKGIVKQAETSIKIAGRIGSLCGVLTRIHSRETNKYYYNTVPYVCRGLPVWNCNVQSLPQ